MNINAVNSFYPVKNIFLKQNTLKSRFSAQPMTKDSVSFTSKIQRNISSSTRVAKELGIKLYREMEKNPASPKLGEIIQKEAPDITVCSIEEMRKIAPYLNDYGAYFRGSMNEDFSCGNYVMLVSSASVEKDKNKMMLRAMDIAHEYTHYQYYKQGLEKKVADKISDNWQYFGTIQAIGSNFLFKIFDNQLQAQTLIPYFSNKRDMRSNNLYSRFLPYEKTADKEQILALSSFKNEKVFREIVNRYFDICFDEALQKFQLVSDNVDPQITKTVRQIVRSGKVEQFKKDLKTYCASLAFDESCAYSTEAEVAREILKTNKSLNIDAFPCYYQLLKDAFLS